MITHEIKKSKIKSVECVGMFDNEYVYDLGMKDQTRPWFFGNNILLHNSSYFKTYADTIEEAIEVADAVADKVNESFQPYMRQAFLCQPGFDDIVKCGREIVASAGIFVDKKRYILRVVDVEGKRVDKSKVMGLDTKKTTLPKAIATQINGYVMRLLKGERWEDIAVDIVDFKTYLTTEAGLDEIGLPKGVKNVEAYTSAWRRDPKTMLPGHVAASILYNNMLEQHGDKESLPIVSGMKIRVYYLNKRIGRFKAIALPTDADTIPKWFADTINVNKDAHILRLVDKPLHNIIKAIGREPPSKQTLLQDDLLVF